MNQLNLFFVIVLGPDGTTHDLMSLPVVLFTSTTLAQSQMELHTTRLVVILHFRDESVFVVMARSSSSCTKMGVRVCSSLVVH